MTPCLEGVTGVVVTHDSAPELERLLASLARHGGGPDQLVVVDTGSRDGSVDVAVRAGGELVELPDNPGFGAANNAGVAAARGDVTLLLNPDAEALDASLEGLAATTRRQDALHVPCLLETSGAVQRSAHPAPGTAGALLPALVPPRLLPRPLRLAADPWRAPGPREVGWAIAACVAARTATLRRLGPFDPWAFLFYEDMDLCLRARASGVPTVLHPDLRLRHTGAHSTAAAFGSEPFDLLARRRREVVATNLGRRALALDDLAQALTFATRAAARRVAGRDSRRERSQLSALLDARGRQR